MPTPPPATPKAKPKNNRAKVLNPKQELFCQLYIKNSILYGNGTLAYAIAFDYKLEKLSREVQRDDGGVLIGLSEYDKSYNVCSVCASQLLRLPKVQTRIQNLLNEMLKDDVVDSKLAHIILQSGELGVSLAGIREYNKLKQRIVEKTDITTAGKPVPILNILHANVPGHHRHKKDSGPQKED